ncbi:AAA family ATPase [Vibrio splendidus]
MIIKRLRVEEGFFNTLDIEFSAALNVLVGGRGVGKTSVIELLRFGLGVQSLTEYSARESTSHALSILQSSGRVIIDLEINGSLVTVARSASETTIANSVYFVPPVIFSQKEIETVSLNSSGKLNLIDSFASDISDHNNNINRISSEIRSKYVSLITLKKECDEAYENISSKNKLLAQEQQLLEQKKIYENNNTTVNSNQSSFELIQKELNDIEVDIHNSNYILSIFNDKVSKLESIISSTINTPTHNNEAINLLTAANNLINEENQQIQTMVNKYKLFIQNINETLGTFQTRKIKLEEESRKYRYEINQITEGAGLVLSQLSNVRIQLANIQNWESILSNKQHNLSDIYQQCQEKINLLSNIREQIYNRRKLTVDALNHSLNPTISIQITHSVELDAYTEELKRTLKGSGLRYNEIAEDITSKVSPQWLLYYTYSKKYEDFANTVGLPLDRATRILGFLNDSDLGALLTAAIEDKIELSLLDKGSYKLINELSIGQRCTVALSIILENSNRILIIDQPEDHLDNEFIASTLIKSLIKRSNSAQTILSSHNANIPVLGNAKQVINLDSNGRNGFVKYAGSLNDNNIKHSIESIMEGGKYAFKQRANFYSEF